MAKWRERGLPLVRQELLLGVAWALGLFLRLAGLPEQILADDEWHALNAALRWEPGELATRLGKIDHCIPLALYDELLLATVGVSEAWLRLPVVAAGIAALVVLPLLVRPWTGRAGSIAFAWLLAVSPVHLYFSRYVRPYGIALLLVFVAVIAAHRWWSSGDRRWAALHVACAALAPWLHLSTLPVAVAPSLFFGAERALRGAARRGRSGREILALGGATAAGLAALLLPPLILGLEDVTGKLGESSIRLETVRGAIEHWTGATDAWLKAVLALLAVAGAARLGRSHPRFLACLGGIVVLQLAAVLVLRPAVIEHRIVLARYALVFVPILLVLVSTGLAGIEERLQRSGAFLPAGALGVPLALTLLLAGPALTTYQGPDNWTNHAYYQYHYGPEARDAFAREILAAGVPGFYAELAEEPPGSLRIVEAPWYYEWGNVPFVLYQRRHRQWMAVGFVAPPELRERPDELPLADPRFRFRHFVHVGDAAGLARRGIDYVVFHRDLKGEIPREIARAPVDVAGWIARYRSRYGEPRFEDASLVVFEVRDRGPSEATGRLEQD